MNNNDLRIVDSVVIVTITTPDSDTLDSDLIVKS